MGEITIQVPSKTKRRYLVEDRKLEDQLMSALEQSAVRLPKNPLNVAAQENAADLDSVKQAVAEFVKTGRVRPVAEFKAELGL